MLAGPDGSHRRHGLNMVWRADRYGVDVASVFVEQLAKILVAPGIGKGAVGAGRSRIVHIAEGDDVATELGERRNIAAAHASGAYASQVDALRLQRPVSDPMGCKRDGRRTGGCAEQGAARKLFNRRAAGRWRVHQVSF